MLAVLITLWVEVNVGRHIVKVQGPVAFGSEWGVLRGELDLQLDQYDLPVFIQ